MDGVDLNLLIALDALLVEGNVTGAARRLGLSSSAMSRTLARLRVATGDPLLVRAGRGLVPTVRATELRDRVHELARDARTVLSSQVSDLDIASLERVFTIRANEGFIELFSAPLVAAVVDAAPRVCLRFAPKPAKDAGPLREGQIDLEIGVLGRSAPEVRIQLLFRDSFVGVARLGHPLLAGAVTPERYAACKHVVASRRGALSGPVDDALKELGLSREIVVVVPSFRDAVRIARQSDLVALVPRSLLGAASTSVNPRTDGLAPFELPVPTPEIAISAMWHPRMDADPPPSLVTRHRNGCVPRSGASKINRLSGANGWFRRGRNRLQTIEIGNAAAGYRNGTVVTFGKTAALDDGILESGPSPNHSLRKLELSHDCVFAKS